MESQELYYVLGNIEERKTTSKVRPLETNERLAILLIIAHVIVFISFAIMNVILREIIQFQENVIEFTKNMKEIINLFGGLI